LLALLLAMDVLVALTGLPSTTTFETFIDVL
jgi:hypothetical protein